MVCYSIYILNCYEINDKVMKYFYEIKFLSGQSWKLLYTCTMFVSD